MLRFINSSHVALLLLVLLMGLTGCGGSGSDSGSPSPAAKAVRFIWPERSRDTAGSESIKGLSSSLSAKLEFTYEDGTNPLTMNVNRDPAKLNVYTVDYPLPAGISPSHTRLKVTFFSQAGAAGTQVGTASAALTYVNDLPVITTVSLISAIAKVESADRTIPIGSPALQLEFTARDSAGSVVPITAGSAVWSATEGQSLMTFTASGMVTAKAAGTAKVQATIDGISSPMAVLTFVNAVSEVSAEEVVAPGYTFSFYNHQHFVTGGIAATVVQNGVISNNGYLYTVAEITPAIRLLSPFRAAPAQVSGSGTGNLALGADGNNVVGRIPDRWDRGPAANFLTEFSHAAVWENGSLRDLNPSSTPTTFLAGIQSSAEDISGGLIGGYRLGAQITAANGSTTFPYYATAWKLSGSASINLNPSSQFWSQALAVSGQLLVGKSYAQYDFSTSTAAPPMHAAAWTSPNEFDYVDIHPSGYTTSEAFGVDGTKIIGKARSGDWRAMLWESANPSSAVDLTEKSGLLTADAIKGNYIAGTVYNAATGVTSLAVVNATNRLSYKLPLDYRGIISDMQLTDAGIDILLMGNHAAGVTKPGRVWIVHVPYSLVP